MQINRKTANYLFLALIIKIYTATIEMVSLPEEYDLCQTGELWEFSDNPFLTSALTYNIDSAYGSQHYSDDSDEEKNEDSDSYFGTITDKCGEEDEKKGKNTHSQGNDGKKRKCLPDLKGDTKIKKICTSDSNIECLKNIKSHSCGLSTNQELTKDGSQEPNTLPKSSNEHDELEKWDQIGFERDRRIADREDKSYRFHISQIELKMGYYKKTMADEKRDSSLNNLFRHVHNPDIYAELKQVTSYAKYKQRIIFALENGCKKYKVFKSSIKHKQELVLFNIWLNKDETKPKKYILGCLYHKLIIFPKLASASSNFEKSLFLSLNSNTTFINTPNQIKTQNLTKNNNHSSISEDVQKNNHDAAIAFFAKYSNMEVTPKGLSASEFYQDFKCSLLLISVDNGISIFNLYYKKLLTYIPELLVCADWRIEEKKLKETKKDLIEEIQCLRWLIISYVECTGKVLDYVKQYRKQIRFLIQNYVLQSNEKTHLFCFAMHLRYHYGTTSFQGEKTKNIVFILSFTAKNRVYDCSLIQLLQMPAIMNITQSLNVLNSQRKNLDLEFILSLQILMEYYNHVGLCHSRKLLIFPWNTQTLAIFYCQDIVRIDLFTKPTIYALMYDELMHDL